MSPLRLEPHRDRTRDAAAGWLLRQADGAALSLAEAAAFERWIAEDDRNLAAYEAALEAWRAMDQLAAQDAVIGLRRDALQAFRQAQRRRWSRGFGPRWSGLTAALSALIFIFVLGYGIHAGGEVYQTGVGERRVVMLADGSKLSLDADTKVVVRYGRARRELNLERGRAKFDVARDETRPFAVSAADKLVVASGTQFSVELVQRQVRVVLYKGHVSVLARGPDQTVLSPLRLAAQSTPADEALAPGRELIASVAAPVAAVQRVDPGRSQSWEGGQLVFDNEPLSLAVARVNRYTNEPFSVGDAQAGATAVNGVFTGGDVQAFVEGVTAVSPVRVERRGTDKVFVSLR